LPLCRDRKGRSYRCILRSTCQSSANSKAPPSPHHSRSPTLPMDFGTERKPRGQANSTGRLLIGQTDVYKIDIQYLELRTTHSTC
jgi:hypothetical protein